MGIGPSMKETTLHYYRDPLIEILSKDEDVNLMGVVVYGSADLNENKMLAAEDIVVRNQYMTDVVCFYKTYDKALQTGDETMVLAENTIESTDVKKALARLKLKMRKRESA